MDLTERFWSKVDRSGGPDACWPWLACLRRGYGSYGIRHGILRYAHRLAYESLVGTVPAGMELDHTCHSRDETCPGGPGCLHRRCVNPAHLEPVDHVQNWLRGRSPSALVARRGVCLGGHARTAENVNPAWGKCRPCDAERHRTAAALRRNAA